MTFLKNEKHAEVLAVTEEKKTTLGQKILGLRKSKGFTQEEFAEKLGVTAQAVSKWENDASCPDIMLLPEIAKIFGVSIDELMGVKPAAEPEVEKVTAEKVEFEPKKDLKLKIQILSPKRGSRPVNIAVPVNFVAGVAGVGMRISSVLGNEALNGVPFDEVINMAKNGISGEILNMTSDDGTIIKIEIS